MNLLNKSINSFSFQDILDFCTEGEIEGLQLDYKKEMPSKGLSKHFASFSNTRGGIIIIGVEEDSSGRPTKYEGIVFDTKIIDKIHQNASKVDPRPSYDVHHTNEVNGKVFILIRIYEGDRTPYYVQNDSNIHIRTGNITDPIGLASPEAVELLFGKKQKAELARNNYIDRTNQVYRAALQREERERLRLIAIEKSNYMLHVERAKAAGETPPQYRSSYQSVPYGTRSSILELLLQPFYPARALIAPKEIKEKRDQIRFSSNQYDFPHYSLNPMQDGVIYFEGQNGGLSCHQLYSNGLMYQAEDVVREDNRHGRIIYIESIGGNLFNFLKVARNFYNILSYQGGLIGYILLKDINNAKLKRIIPNGYRPGLFWDHEKEVPIMNDYQWKIEIETSLINDNSKIQSWFIDKMKEIYWSIGYEDPEENLLKAFLKDNRWLEEER